MILTPEDFACFIYCPKTLETQVYKQKVVPSLTYFEDKVRLAIIEAERNILLKDGELNIKKMHQAWDKIWWPAIPSSKISLPKAEELTIKAGIKLSDYCKYDISDYLYPTAGVDLHSEISIGSSILKTQIDLIKVNLKTKKKNILLVDMSRKKLSTREMVLDPAIRAKAYSFYSGEKESVSYACIDLNEKENKLTVSTVVFRAQEMEKIKKMLFHIERGIRKGVFYMNRWQCKECQICQNFKF